MARGKGKKGGGGGDRSLLEKWREEVNQLGASNMDKKEKKNFVTTKLIALGAKPPKGTHIPLPIFKGILKKKRETEEKEFIKQRELGEKVKKSKAPRRDPKYARKNGDGSFNIGKGFAKSVATARSKPKGRK